MMLSILRVLFYVKFIQKGVNKQLTSNEPFADDFAFFGQFFAEPVRLPGVPYLHEESNCQGS